MADDDHIMEQGTVPTSVPDEPSVNAGNKPRKKGGVFLGAAGALVIAGLGFGAALWGQQKGLIPLVTTENPDILAQISVLNAKIDAQKDVLARVSALEEKMTALPQTDGSADAAQEQKFQDALRELQSKITLLEAQPTQHTMISAEIAQQIDQEVQKRFEKADHEAEQLRQNETKAAQKMALLQMQYALTGGADLQENLIVFDRQNFDVPPAWGAYAAAPLSLVDVQNRFADAARAALAAVRKPQAQENLTDRATVFFQGQLGMRSLVPREGNDPDAVLSRMEAALKDAQVADALAMMAVLPPEGQEAMRQWRSDAQKFMDAQNILTQLMSSVQ